MIPFVQTGACPVFLTGSCFFDKVYYFANQKPACFFEGRLLLYIPHKRRKNDLIKLLDDLKKEAKI